MVADLSAFLQGTRLAGGSLNSGRTLHHHHHLQAYAINWNGIFHRLHSIKKIRLCALQNKDKAVTCQFDFYPLDHLSEQKL
jgi:hypothetical protein